MGNRLLLADDSITIQKVVAIIFANEEFELTVVDNGIAALQKAREGRPDVMLVDALMPGKSGYEVCAEIRRDPQLCSTPILLLIGAFEPFDEEKARECGADASITKPFESQQLIDRVKELLELGQSRRAAPVAAPVSVPTPTPAPAPTPTPAPLPIESAAEELWGDLSSFDTMPPAEPALAAAPAAPIVEPAAAAPFTAPVAPAPVAPAPAVPAAPVQAPTYAAAPAPASQPAASTPAPEFEEASYEDDLWGAFELEEAPQNEVSAPSAGAFGGFEAESEFEAEEFFSFDDESEAIDETGPAIDFGAAIDEPVVQPAAEEEFFNFADETPVATVSAVQPDPANFPVEEPFSFEPEAEAPAALFGAEPAAFAELAPEISPQSPVFEPAVAPVPPAALPAAQPAAQPAPFALSEADLVAALSKVSREVIERIVWEVVPDLAEVLIKEEIRKLRAGVKG